MTIPAAILGALLLAVFTIGSVVAVFTDPARTAMPDEDEERELPEHW